MVENPQVGKKYWCIDTEFHILKIIWTPMSRAHVNLENIFPDGYEGHMDAFDEAIRRVNGERKSLLQEADKLKWKLHYITKERNAVRQK